MKKPVRNDGLFHFLYKTKNPPNFGGFSINFKKSNNYFTFADNSVPALNLTTFLAAILISLPV